MEGLTLLSFNRFRSILLQPSGTLKMSSLFMFKFCGKKQLHENTNNKHINEEILDHSYSIPVWLHSRKSRTGHKNSFLNRRKCLGRFGLLGAESGGEDRSTDHDSGLQVSDRPQKFLS